MRNPTLTALALPLSALLIVACGDKDGTVEGDSTATGQATYRDAETDSDGASREPARPAPQEEDTPMWVEVRLEGTGEVDLSGGGCETDGLGSGLEVLYQGEAVVDEDGVYTAGFVSSEASVVGAPECSLPDLSLSAVTGVVVEGQLETTTQNCETWCDSHARAEAEQECSGDSDEASCRTEAEAETAAECTTTCEDPDTWAIVARTELGAAQVTEVSAAMVAGEGLIDLQADLEFDMMVDQDGNEVSN